MSGSLTLHGSPQMMPQPQDLLESEIPPSGANIDRRFAAYTSYSREAIARCVSRSGMKAFNSMPRVLFCSPPPGPGHRPASRTEFRCKLFDGNYGARSPLPHETCPFVLIACVMPARGAERRGVASRGTSSSSNSQSTAPHWLVFAYQQTSRLFHPSLKTRQGQDISSSKSRWFGRTYVD